MTPYLKSGTIPGRQEFKNMAHTITGKIMDKERGREAERAGAVDPGTARKIQKFVDAFVVVQ